MSSVESDIGHLKTYRTKLVPQKEPHPGSHPHFKIVALLISMPGQTVGKFDKEQRQMRLRNPAVDLSDRQ